MPDLPFDKVKGHGLLYGDKYVLAYTKGRGQDQFSIGIGASLRKVVQTFPLTESGWTEAFEAFANLEPEAAEQTLSRARSEVFGELWHQRVAGALGLMPGSLFLGGHGVALNPGLAFDLLFDQDGLVVAKDFAPMVQIPYREIERLDISGRGEVKSGGGFIGGGFGLEGAVTGIAIAALLNAATTSSRMETVLQLEASNAEAFFHYGRATPERLRIELSAVFGRIRRQTAPPTQKESEVGIADQLSKLADLRREGMLSDEEFDAAKRRLIGG